MTELEENIFIEKYRPRKFEELILADKGDIMKYLDSPKMIPSFIFHSSKPGTGKTSTAKLIIDYLKCDSTIINASSERGIDTIRESVNRFARSLSSNPEIKKCVFMDEADGLTKQAQDSLRNLMEEYSDNVFFILSCNDLSKITEPIRSRCVAISFENPNKNDIFMRLNDIVDAEGIGGNLQSIVDSYYPDMRQMLHALNKVKITGQPWKKEDNQFEQFYQLIKSKNIRGICDTVYAGDFDVMAFNKWFFDKLFKNYQDFKNVSEISLYIADTEKSWALGVNVEIIFIANILQICKLL